MMDDFFVGFAIFCVVSISALIGGQIGLSMGKRQQREQLITPEESRLLRIHASLQDEEEQEILRLIANNYFEADSMRKNQILDAARNARGATSNEWFQSRQPIRASELIDFDGY